MAFQPAEGGRKFQARGQEALSPDSRILASLEVIRLPGLRERGTEAWGRWGPSLLNVLSAHLGS